MSDDEGELDESELIDYPGNGPTNYGLKKRRIVLMLLAYAAIFGVIVCILPEDNRALDIVVGLPFVILSVWWVFIDAEERDHRIGGLMRLVLIFAFAIGLPIYLLQTRGIRGVQTIAVAALLFAAMIACMFATAFVTSFLVSAPDL